MCNQCDNPEIDVDGLCLGCFLSADSEGFETFAEGEREDFEAHHGDVVSLIDPIEVRNNGLSVVV